MRTATAGAMHSTAIESTPPPPFPGGPAFFPTAMTQLIQTARNDGPAFLFCGLLVACTFLF